MRLTEEEFTRERRYQTVMYFVRKMLEQGLISEEDYCRIDTRNREKFKPFTGDLLSGNFLLCASKRVMNCTWKEADSHEECNETGTATAGSETENKGGGLRQGLDGD